MDFGVRTYKFFVEGKGDSKIRKNTKNTQAPEVYFGQADCFKTNDSTTFRALALRQVDSKIGRAASGGGKN